MSDDPSQKAELTRKCQDIVSQAADISKNINEAQEFSQLVNDDYSKDLHTRLMRLCEGTMDLISREQKKLLDFFSTIDSLIEERERQELRFELPTRDELRDGFNSFINTVLPVWKGSTTPVLCGAMPFPTSEKIIEPGSYACIKFEDNYILAFVMGYDPELMAYHCCDADPDQDDPIKEIIVPLTDIIPTPRSAPARRTKANTFSPKTRVLGLWPDDNGFTSVFYPAIVKAQPNQSQAWYRLSFEGDVPQPAEVPEKFIVRFPE